MATPKRQAYPASRIKVGAVLYRAFAVVNKGKVETGFEDWVVRNIRARRNSKTKNGISLVSPGFDVPKVVNLALKTQGTWGKLSSKTGDYGWLPNIDSAFRRQFQVGADLPFGIYTTKRAALAYELASQNEDAEWLVKEIAGETDAVELDSLQAELGEIKAQIAALQRRSKSLARV